MKNIQDNTNTKIFRIRKIKKRNLLSIQSWTPQEDDLLITLYKPTNIKKWVNMAKSFPGKDQKECMLRFLKINPRIKRGKWNFEEDRNLYYLVKLFGYRWGLFAKILKNRNHKQIRSRYYHYFMRYKEQNKKEIKKVSESVEIDPPIGIL